jgi:phospholipase C
MMSRYALGLGVAATLLAGCGRPFGSAQGDTGQAQGDTGGGLAQSFVPNAETRGVPSPIRHIVVLVQENRSFNTLFAGFPGANTAMEGRCAPARWCKGSHMVKLHSVPLQSNVGLCDSHACFETECDPNASNVCQMDGFDLLRFGVGSGGTLAKLYPYAYVDRAETKPYWNLAHGYALADEMFFNNTSGSFVPNLIVLRGSVRINDRESLVGPAVDPPYGCNAPPGDDTEVIHKDGRVTYNGPLPCFDWASIATLLDAKSVPWKYYVDDGSDFSGNAWNGFTAFKQIYHGPDWKRDISSPNTNVFDDVKSGSLPAVSWIIPSFYDSDQAGVGCNGGPWWVTKVVNAIGKSPYWKSTAIVVVWADWGSWYDNAAPAQINYTSLGFRVPMIVVSPYARPGYVSHTRYDFGSILKFMEQTFKLGSLGTTDRSAASMEDVFDFVQTPIQFKVAPLPKALPCKDKVTNPGA